MRSIVLAAGDKGVFGPYDGLSGYGQWTEKGSGAKFVHNGKSYTFTSGFNAGSGSANRRSFYFTPEQACIVTVAYTAQKGRPLYIYQNGVLLASGEAGATDGYAAALEADIEDPTAGDVYIYGGSSDKQLYGIFVDYYDPNVITYRNLSGKVNYAGSADLSNVKLVFTDEKDGTRYETAMGTEYSVDLRQNRNYKISVEADGAVSETLALTLDTNSVAIKKMDLTFDLSLVDIAPTQVTGEVVVHDINNDDTTLDLSKVQLTFTATDDPTYTYTTGVTDNKINVTMMPNHEYAITATGIDGYTMSALSQSYVMAAGDTSPFKNILFCEDVTEVPFAATIEVGTDKAYATINDAITAVSKMTDRPANEAGRVTIVIDPGVYTEQVMVTPSYVTLKAADEANRPEVQWYYGIGYLYYSSDGGYYSEDYAVQKTTKNPVTRWGSACRITGQYVYVENIIFKNTFNCEVTEAELADGVAPAQNNEYSDTNNKPDRTVAGYDARSQSATERAAAIALDGGFTELYRCDFISSQDTFYTNKNAYVKECYIEGGTDFVYGGNAILFEDCTLAWHGYSDGAKGGYLTACKTSGAPSADTINTAGYKFVNTTVTNSKYYPDNKFHAGSWGRNWGGAACQVVFDGVTLDGVDTPGEWVKMGGELKDSVLYVNNVTDKNGADVNVSGKTFNPNGTMAANGYTTLADTEFFGGTWVPPHYSGDIQLTEYTTQWMFGKSNGAAEYALEGTDGTTEIVGTSNAPEEQVLGVDATNGKFNNATRTDEWAQVNTGTVFTVPVVNGSVITFGSYAAEILEANGTEFTKNDRFTYVGAGGTIDVTVLSGGYLSYIKVVSPVDPEEYDPTEYSITITEGYTNGTVEVSKTTAVAGETITLTATPAEGYVIDTYEVKTAGGVEITVKDGDFTMPADNVTVTVTFKEYVQPEQGDTIDYVMPFAANASGNSSTTVDGTVINTTGNYTLFDNYVQLQNMGFSNAHGLSGTGPIVVQVPGPVDITVGTCVYDDFKLVVKDSANNVVGEVDDIVGSSQPLTAGGNGTYGCYESNGSKVVVSYEGEATTLTISFESSTNGASANARFWLPYLRVNSTQAAGKYSDWKVGQAGENNTDGNIEVVEYEGKESLFVRKRNAYTTLDEAVSTGKVEFTTSVWIDPATSIFRIYLENENGSNYQDNKNTKSAVFAEVINNTSSGTLCVGPALGSSTVAGDSLAGTAAGWYDIKIALDYDKADTNEFITVTVNNAAGEQVLNQSMAAIDGIDKNLKQIRLIARGDDVAYFADMQVTIGGETPVPTATATAAPATPAPTATATAAPATATPTNVPAEPVTASYTAPASGTTLAANATLIKNDGVDMYTTGAVTVAENVDSNYDTATYKSRIPFRGNATIKAHIDDINNANIKADNTSVVIKAIQSGTFTAKVGIDKTKTMRLWDNTDDKEVHSVTPDVKAVTTFEYDLIAGHDYLFYASGTSANLYSVEYTYTPGEAVVPTPPATEEPTATPVPTATATPDQPQYEATLSYDGGEAQNGTFEELLAAIPANAANAVITLHKDVVIADGSDQIEIKSSVKVTSDAATGVTVTQGKCIKIPGGAAITLDGNITFKGTSSATSGYGRKHMFAITGANGKFIANSGVTLDYSEAETADEFSIVRTDWNGSGQEIQINGATVNGGSAYLNYTNSNNEDITKITGAAAVNAKVHAGYIKEEGSHTVIDLDGYTGDPINVELYTTTKNTAGLVIAKNVSDISKINLAENNAWDVELSGTDVVLKAKGIPVEISIPETKTTYEGGEAALSSTVVNTGETITVTETAYYGFEAQTPECKAVTASGETPVTVSGADGVYTFTGIEGAEKYIVTPKFAQKDTTKAILYLGDSTVANNSGERIQMDKDIKLMNYVKDGAAATWESAEVPSDVSSAKVVSTISGKPAVTLTVNQASGDRTDITSDAAISNFKAAGTRFYVSELDLSNISFTASDSVTITVNAADGGTGYLGNYWYIIFE